MFLIKVCSATACILLAFVFSPVANPHFDHSQTPGISMHAAADTTEWPRPRFEERKEERRRMVSQALEANGITDPATLEAMRNVPRHLFVPGVMRGFAYQNTALPIGHGQTISQPYVVAYMTQLLNLDAGEKVLEIGTGSGYQAAVLSEITPEVYTIEIVEELAKETRSLFDELGYTAIKSKIGDGYKGWEEHAPFDAIILTAAADEIPDPLVKQLKPAGIMVMPVGEPGATQELVKITKNADGTVRKESLLPVRFVPMTREGSEGN